MVAAFGGACAICGYNKHCALIFHHVNPEEKEFSLGGARSSPRSWKRLVKEMRKCVMLCRNCHSEVHAGLTPIPPEAQRFDETFAQYRTKAPPKPDCEVCGNPVIAGHRFCSCACSNGRYRRVEWDDVDLPQMARTMPVTRIAERLGVSSTAVHKQLKKRGIKSPWSGRQKFRRS